MTSDEMSMLAMTVFVLAGLPKLTPGQRVRWALDEKLLTEFSPNEWEVVTWTDPETHALVFELREKVDEAFGLPQSMLRRLMAPKPVPPLEEWVRIITAIADRFYVTTRKSVGVYTASPDVWMTLSRAARVRELTTRNVSPDLQKTESRLYFLGVEIELDPTLPPDSFIPHARA